MEGQEGEENAVDLCGQLTRRGDDDCADVMSLKGFFEPEEPDDGGNQKGERLTASCYGLRSVSIISLGKEKE